MNNRIVKKVIGLVVAFISAIGIFAGFATEQAVAIQTHMLYVDLEYATNPNVGHTHPGGTGGIDKKIGDMWNYLPITVSDDYGDTFNVDTGFSGAYRRYVGFLAEGDMVTISIDTSRIADGYHVSYIDNCLHSGKSRNYATFRTRLHLRYDGNFVVTIPFGKLKVKFDLQGGKIDGESDPITKIVKKDNTVDFPANPTKGNLEFGGWFTERTTTSNDDDIVVGKRYYWTNKLLFSDYNNDSRPWNDEKIDPQYDQIFVLRAQWNAKATFNANGGKFSDDNSSDKIVKEEQNKKIKILAAPTRAGYKFLNWKDAAGNTYNPGAEYELKANTVFTAQWQKTNYTVTFKDSDNKQIASIKVEPGKTIDGDSLTNQSMPKNPTKSGYKFKEWNTQADGNGKKFTGASVVNTDITVYAVFTNNPPKPPTPPTPPTPPEPVKPTPPTPLPTPPTPPAPEPPTPPAPEPPTPPTPPNPSNPDEPGGNNPHNPNNPNNPDNPDNPDPNNPSNPHNPDNPPYHGDDATPEVPADTGHGIDPVWPYIPELNIHGDGDKRLSTSDNNIGDVHNSGSAGDLNSSPNANSSDTSNASKENSNNRNSMNFVNNAKIHGKLSKTGSAAFAVMLVAFSAVIIGLIGIYAVKRKSFKHKNSRHSVTYNFIR